MKRIILIIILAVVVAACSPNAETTVEDPIAETPIVVENTDTGAQSADENENDDEMEEVGTDIADDSDEAEHSDDMMDESDEMASEETDEMTDESTTPETDDMADGETDNAMTVSYNGPEWTNLELINAKTGETFTLADFAGKTVFIEPMATWCTNCLNQQRRIKDVVGELSPDDYVIMSLSVEKFLDYQELGDYANRHEFGWTFAVVSEDLLAALVTEFGRSVASPPSVPHFTISPTGEAGNFTTGSKTGEEFLALVRGVAG